MYTYEAELRAWDAQVWEAEVAREGRRSWWLGFVTGIVTAVGALVLKAAL
jgi:hypothetical protein